MMKKNLIYIILGVVVLVIPILLKNRPSLVGYLNLVMIYSIAVIGLNLLLGIAGQISLGHAAFMAIGGYTSAILVMNLNLPSLLGILLGVIFAAFFGFLIGFPSLRLKGFYLAIATMALSTAITDIIKRLQITGSDHGLMNIPPISIFNFSFSSEISKYYLFLVFLVITIILIRNFLRGKSGMALRAMRDSEYGALACGINISYYKILAFVISSALAGLAGALYAHSISYLHPMNFGLGLSIDFLAITIIGGLGTLFGPILGSFLWIILPRFFGTHLESMATVVFGIILIIIVLFLPRGLYEIIEKFDRILKRPVGAK
jgi:branched-chain amino acid transport system permease protein